MILQQFCLPPIQRAKLEQQITVDRVKQGRKAQQQISQEAVDRQGNSNGDPRSPLSGATVPKLNLSHVKGMTQKTDAS